VGEACPVKPLALKGTVMKAWLRCTLYPGQFGSELAVVVKSYKGQVFSLFASKEDLEYDEPPTNNCPVDGLVKVQLVKRQGNLLLVYLPQCTIENGQYLTVAENQIERIPVATAAQSAT